MRLRRCVPLSELRSLHLEGDLSRPYLRACSSKLPSTPASMQLSSSRRQDLCTSGMHLTYIGKESADM